MPDNETEWITVKEAADLVRVNRTTVWRWVKGKYIEARQLGGWLWQVDKAGVIAHKKQMDRQRRQGRKGEA